MSREMFEDIHDYACDKEPVLRQFRYLPAGIPAHDLRNRIFTASTQRNVRRWIANIVT